MSTKAVIVGVGLGSVAGIALASFMRNAVGCTDNETIFCPEKHDQTGVLAQADVCGNLNSIPVPVKLIDFTGPSYALEGQ